MRSAGSGGGISWSRGGDVTYLEWIVDLIDYLKPAGDYHDLHPHPELRVESGFLNLYTAQDRDCKFCKSSAMDQVLSELECLLWKYRDEQLRITITGHGLGSALAMLSAYDVAQMGSCRLESIPITVFSFAGPRVGNAVFKERCEELGLKFLRIVNVKDIVPKFPGMLFNEKFHMMKKWVDKFPWSYHHVGVELALDHIHSSFLGSTQYSFLNSIDNACYFLAIIAGVVNKSCEFLKDHNLLPPFSGQDANRELINKLTEVFKTWIGMTLKRVINESSRFPSLRFINNICDIRPIFVGLVNKSLDFLKDRYQLLPLWWQGANRGLINKVIESWESWIQITMKIAIQNLSRFHDLKAYLHLLDGYHGSGQQFHLSSGCDAALMNKPCYFV